MIRERREEQGKHRAGQPDAPIRLLADQGLARCLQRGTTRIQQLIRLGRKLEREQRIDRDVFGRERRPHDQCCVARGDLQQDGGVFRVFVGWPDKIRDKDLPALRMHFRDVLVVTSLRLRAPPPAHATQCDKQHAEREENALGPAIAVPKGWPGDSAIGHPASSKTWYENLTDSRICLSDLARQRVNSATNLESRTITDDTPLIAKIRQHNLHSHKSVATLL